jgi:hypothetical protein
MSQFVQVGNSNLPKKHTLPVICCSSQGIEKERDPRHFVRLSAITSNRPTIIEMT